MTAKAGFYRIYPSDRVTSIDEAIALAKQEAATGVCDFDPESLEVSRQHTGRNEAGNYMVGLFGRTKKSLARERKAAARAAEAKERREAAGEAEGSS